MGASEFNGGQRAGNPVMDFRSIHRGSGNTASGFMLQKPRWVLAWAQILQSLYLAALACSSRLLNKDRACPLTTKLSCFIGLIVMEGC